MKKLKNNKGVTLIILIITVIVLLILTSVNINSARNQIGLKEVNNLYSDINLLTAKVTDYYLRKNQLPVSDNAYLSGRNIEHFFPYSQVNGMNINDSYKYYVIDLAKLDNVTLHYGKDYYKWTSSSQANNDINNPQNNNDDIYIINERTHQIYYPKGIRNATGYVITNTINNNTITAIPYTYSEEIINDNNIKKVDNSIIKTISSTNTERKVVIETKIELNKNLFSNYKEGTLEFQYAYKGEVNNQKYTKFGLKANDETTSTAILTSNTIKVQSGKLLYLYIRIQNQNGIYRRSEILIPIT